MDQGNKHYRRFLNGEESAFDDILSLYRFHLIYFLNRYVHNVAIAEDLAEDTFLELLIHKQRFHFQSSLKSYLFTIGRNKALNYIKHSKIAYSRFAETIPVEQETIDLEEQLLQKEKLGLLNLAMQELKEEYRIALHLIYFEEMSYEEAGKVMHKSRKQIENYAYRARNALKSILEQEGFQE